MASSTEFELWSRGLAGFSKQADADAFHNHFLVLSSHAGLLSYKYIYAQVTSG